MKRTTVFVVALMASSTASAAFTTIAQTPVICNPDSPVTSKCTFTYDGGLTGNTRVLRDCKGRRGTSLIFNPSLAVVPITPGTSFESVVPMSLSYQHDTTYTAEASALWQFYSPIGSQWITDEDQQHSASAQTPPEESGETN